MSVFAIGVSRLQLRPAGQRRGLRVAARPTRVQAASTAGASAESIAELVARKEAELQDLLTPGKRMPKAAVVAAYRKEISALRAQLAPPAAAPAFVVEEEEDEEEEEEEEAGSSALGSSRAVAALRLVEAALASGPGGSGVALSSADLAEFEELQREHEALRARADAALARQAQLQAVLDGKSKPARGRPTRSTAAAKAAVAGAGAGGKSRGRRPAARKAATLEAAAA